MNKGKCVDDADRAYPSRDTSDNTLYALGKLIQSIYIFLALTYSLHISF